MKQRQQSKTCFLRSENEMPETLLRIVRFRGKEIFDKVVVVIVY